MLAAGQSNTKMSEFLSIGDHICLYCEETEGYVFSSETSSQYNSIYILQGQDRLRPTNLPTVHAISFRVTIQSRYKLNKNYRRYRAAALADKDNVELKAQLSQAKSSAEAENLDNVSEEKRQMSKRVRYGDIIQLQHDFSNKYVHVSTTTTSNRDKNNMQVLLHDYHAKHAQFRILPRYKVKSEGEYVQYGDQVVFESFKSPGHYFHASIPWHVYQEFFGAELNLGIAQTGFTIVKHSGPRKDLTMYEMYVEGSSVVRLFHKDLEAFVVAEGIFNGGLSEDVHLRVREVDYLNPKKILPPTSAICYFQVEPEDSMINGGVIHWEQQIRFRHMVSRLYLYVAWSNESQTELDVSLTDEANDPRTVFRLHPVLLETDEVRFGSYARIEHVLSGYWLHADKEKKFELRRERESTDDGTTAGLRWDEASVCILSACESKRYVDVYTMQHVEPELVHIFNSAAGMVPFVKRLIKWRQQGRLLNAATTHRTVCALHELRDFMFVNGEPDKNRQKLLRNLLIVDLLVQLLQNPLEAAPDYIYLKDVCKAAYDVLHMYLIGGRKKNALYLAKYINFFQEQLHLKGQMGLNIAQMLVELIRNNRKIVDRITTAQIDDIVALVRERKNYQLLELLSVLCVCDGVAITNNQDQITGSWLRNERSDVYLVERGQYLNRQHNVAYISTDSGANWTPLHDFVNMEHPAFNEDKYQFLDRQLELMGKLAAGRNSFAVRTITKDLDILTWEQAFFCLRSDIIPPPLRAKYCRLIIQLFVDVGSNYSVLDHKNLTFVYKDVADPRATWYKEKEVAKDLVTVYPVVRDWMAEFLEENTEICASDVGKNVLVCEVLRLLHFMVRFGYYSNATEIRILLKPLLRLIDGRTDRPFPRQPEPESREVRRALKSYTATERYKKSPESLPVMESKCIGLQVLELLFTFQSNTRLEAFVAKFKSAVADTEGVQQLNNLSKKPSKEVSLQDAQAQALADDFDAFDQSKKGCRSQKVLMQELQAMFEESSYFDVEQITAICLDLSIYQYDEMLTQSLSVLNKIYSGKTDLFKLAVHAQVLLTQESMNVHTYLLQMMPVIRQLSRAKLNQTQADIACEIFDTFTSFCHLRFQDAIRHAMNQNIMVSHGVLNVIFDTLSQEFDVRLQDQYGAVQRVWKKALICLRKLTHGNEEVQKRVFDRIDNLLAVVNVEKELALTLREAFIDNQNNCLHIQPKHIVKIMNLVAIHLEQAPELLDLLCAIVKVEGTDLALKRNQGLVMKYLMPNYYKIGYILDKKMEEKLHILKSQDKATERTYMVSLVDLLAKCAEGENRYLCESMCQTILPIDDVLLILNDRDIDNNVKKAYLVYFLWVYMCTTLSMVESGASELPHHPQIWYFIEGLVEEVQALTDYALAHPFDVIDLLHVIPTKGFVPPPEDLAAIAQGGFHYILESVLPFLNTFINKFYARDAECYPNESPIIDRLANALTGFSAAVRRHISNAAHLKTLLLCMPTIISGSGLPRQALEKFIEVTTGSMDIEDPAHEHTELYRTYYANEEAINKRFTTFAVNCSLVYGGHNTVEAQLKVKSKREYTALGGDEDLPLGEEFQAHVRCFIDDSEPKNLRKKYAKAEKLVKQLEISSQALIRSESVRQAQEELDVKSLQILRAMIHNEERKLPADWDRETQDRRVQKQLALIRNIQNALNEPKAVIRCLDHLGRPSNLVFREVMAFTAMMLYNANRNVQSSMLEYFTGCREESFFFAIRQRLQLSQVSIKERRSLKAQHEARLKEAVTQAQMLQDASRSATLSGPKSSHGWDSLHTTLSRKSVTNIGIQKCTSLTRLQSEKSHKLLKQRGDLLVTPAYFGKYGSSLKHGFSSNTLVSSKTGDAHLRPDAAPLLLNGNAQYGLPADVESTELKEVKVEQQQPLSVSIVDGLNRLCEENDESFEYKDEGFIILTLKVLASMCDGQHEPIQSYLRHQPDNIKSINIVAETARFLDAVYANISSATIGLVIQLFDTLAEFTGGNQQNRVALLDNKVVDYINFILRSGKYEDCPFEEQLQLRQSIANLLMLLVEENSPEASMIAKEVKDTVDKPALFQTMKECYEAHAPEQGSKGGRLAISSSGGAGGGSRTALYQERACGLSCKLGACFRGCSGCIRGSHPTSSSSESMSDELRESLYSCGFTYFTVLMRFYDIDPSIGEMIKTFITPGQAEAFNFYKKSSLSVEIMKDGHLQKINFRVLNKNVLRKEVKEKLKWNIDRSSPSNKIVDLMAWSHDILKDINYQRRILRNPVAMFFTRLWLFWNYSCLLLSVAINITMLFTWNAPMPMSQVKWEESSTIPQAAHDLWPDTTSLPAYDYVIYGLGGAHNLFSLCVIISYFVSNHPRPPRFKCLKEYFSRKKAAAMPSKDKAKADLSVEEPTRRQQRKSKLDASIFSLSTFYYVTFVVMSAAGTVFHGYFFAFHLLNVVNNNHLLKGVIKAVTKNGWSLLWVAILGFILIYIYSLVSFAFMRSLFNQKQEMFCDTLFQCTITIVRHGLIGDLFQKLTMHKSEATFVTFAVLSIFHLSFFVMISTIGLNIIFGIIVDTFSELRDLKWQTESDMRDMCLICNRSSHDFEHYGSGFVKHVTHEHNMWAYVFFFIHLDDTKPNDYGAIEHYVYSLLIQDKYDFFPLNKALCLEQSEEAADGRIDEILSAVKEIAMWKNDVMLSQKKTEEKRRQKAWQAQHRPTPAVLDAADLDLLLPPPPPGVDAAAAGRRSSSVDAPPNAFLFVPAMSRSSSANRALAPSPDPAAAAAQQRQQPPPPPPPPAPGDQEHHADD